MESSLNFSEGDMIISHLRKHGISCSLGYILAFSYVSDNRMPVGQSVYMSTPTDAFDRYYQLLR